MPRGSDKRSPRLDDEMDSEVRALLQSGVTEGRSDALAKEDLLDDERGAVRPGLPEDALEARSELARWLLPHAFPADADALTRVAAGQGAPDRVLDALHRLPSGVTFTTVEAVWESLGGPGGR